MKLVRGYCRVFRISPQAVGTNTTPRMVPAISVSVSKVAGEADLRRSALTRCIV